MNIDWVGEMKVLWKVPFSLKLRWGLKILKVDRKKYEEDIKTKKFKLQMVDIFHVAFVKRRVI